VVPSACRKWVRDGPHSLLQHKIHSIVLPPPISPYVERILLIPVSSRFHCYKIPNTLFRILIIWNACYLECLVFGILSYSTSFTKFRWFHSLPIYYGFPSILRTINHFSFHPRTFNSSTVVAISNANQQNRGLECRVLQVHCKHSIKS